MRTTTKNQQQHVRQIHEDSSKATKRKWQTVGSRQQVLDSLFIGSFDPDIYDHACVTTTANDVTMYEMARSPKIPFLTLLTTTGLHSGERILLRQLTLLEQGSHSAPLCSLCQLPNRPYEMRPTKRMPLLIIPCITRIQPRSWPCSLPNDLEPQSHHRIIYRQLLRPFEPASTSTMMVHHPK